MTESEQDLARKLAAHPGWTWMPGMLSDDGRRITDVRDGNVWADDCYYDTTDAEWRKNPLGGPDLSDPATQGCLIAMLRATLGLCIAELVLYGPHDGKKAVGLTITPLGETPYGQIVSSVGEALARALLAAWGE